MIPFPSLSYLIALFISLASLVKIHSSYQRTRIKSIRYFLIVFILLVLTLTLMSLPGFVVKDRLIIQVIILVSRLFGFLALIFFTLIPLEAFGWKKIKKIYLLIIALGSLPSLFFAFIKITPVNVLYGKNYIIYKTSEDPRILIFTFSLYLLNLLGLIGVFLYQGLKSKEKFVRKRSFMISGGEIFILLGVAANIFLLKPEIVFYSVIIATVIGLPGAFLIVKAVLLKKEEKPIQPIPKKPEIPEKPETPHFHW